MSASYDEEPTKHLDVWREQVDMARRASRDVSLGFLDSLFIYYPKSVRITEMNDDRQIE